MRKEVSISILLLIFLASCAAPSKTVQCLDGSVAQDISMCKKTDTKLQDEPKQEIQKQCPKSCDDKDECTTDSCSAEFTCVHKSIENCGKSKNELISLKSNEILISSSQVEAGYSLDRDSSGRIVFRQDLLLEAQKAGIVDSFIKGFYKSGTSGLDERGLYFYGYTFKDEKGAESFKNLIMNESKLNYSYKEFKKCDGFDFCEILQNVYKYDYIGQKKLDVLLRQKNVFVEILFRGAEESITDTELNIYLQKLRINLEKGAPEPLEIPLDKESEYNNDRSSVDVEIQDVTSGLSIPKGSDYKYYDLEELPYEGDGTYKLVKIRMKNIDVADKYTIEGTSYVGLYPGPETFSLEDEKGDLYSVAGYTQYLDGFSASLELEGGKTVVTRLAFLVPKNSKKFKLRVFDWDGDQVAKVDVPNSK